MFNKKQIVTFTNAAISKIQNIIKNSNIKSVKGIRITLIKKGCAGMEYKIDLISEYKKNDEVFKFKNILICIENKAILFLIGTKIDYEISKFKSGFIFNNPNTISMCGCGESVLLKKNI